MRDRSYPKLKEKPSKISQQEIDDIREDAKNAQALLENPYLTSYLDDLKKEILDMHVKQLVYDAKEEHDVPGGKRVIELPSEKEYLILAGQYRLAEQIIADAEQIVEIGKELEKRIKDETVEVLND